MTPSQKCIDFIKSFEGIKLEAYYDSAHIPTIGYGTIRYPNNERVEITDTCTQDEAEEWLKFEIDKKAAGVSASLKETPVSQCQFDSLVSFAYNLGNGALDQSTLLKKVKQDPHDKTIYNYGTYSTGRPVINSCEFLRWVKAGGEVVKGLVTRRAAESDMYAGK